MRTSSWYKVLYHLKKFCSYSNCLFPLRFHYDNQLSLIGPDIFGLDVILRIRSSPPGFQKTANHFFKLQLCVKASTESCGIPKAVLGKLHKDNQRNEECSFAICIFLQKSDAKVTQNGLFVSRFKKKKSQFVRLGLFHSYLLIPTVACFFSKSHIFGWSTVLAKDTAIATFFFCNGWKVTKV